jgi:nucleoside-diphosphate-sugar epimerase
LLEAGLRVTAVSRRAPAAGWRPDRQVLWLPPDALIAGAGSDASENPADPRFLVSCGPLDYAADLLGRFGSLQRVVAFSSSSVLSKAASADRPERAEIASLTAAESALAESCGQRDLPLLLLRPTLIYGCGLDRNVSLLYRFGRRFGFIPFSRRSSGLRQPVHAEDLAALAVQALLREDPARLTSPACGGERLPLPLPRGLMVGLAALISVLTRSRAVSPEMVRRQDRDLVFDDAPLRAALAWRPRGFRPSAADFEVPAHARSLQLPR